MATPKKVELQSGEIRWVIQVFKKGYKRYTIRKKTKAAAVNEARRVALAMDDGTWDEFASEEQKHGNTSLEYFIQRYLKEITPHKEGAKKGIINETSALNQVLRTPLGKMDIYRIKTGHVIEVSKAWRDKGNKPETIIRKLTTLHDVFKHIQTTWRHESIINPVKGSKPRTPAGSSERSRTLNEKELTSLRDALNQCRSPYVRWLFDLALETAGRRRELFENTWKKIHLEKEYMQIDKTIPKTRKSRFVPLTPEAQKTLVEMKKHHDANHPDSEELFPITEKAFEEAWKAAKARSKVEDFQFQDTRHMATTMLSNIYPKMQDLAKITGHKKLETLLIYYEEDIDDQVAQMKAHHKNKTR